MVGVAVIGGGVAGISAALDLANSGFKVYLIEKGGELGGKMAELAECKTGLLPKIVEIKNHPNIEVLLSCEVAQLSGSAGNFKIRVEGEGGNKEIEVDSIVLAVGYDVFSEIPKSYAIDHPDVLTSLEFERRLVANKGELLRPSNGEKVKRIAFIQCIGSRDTKNMLCSTACCGYTAKEAKMVKERFPDVDVFIFYMDIRAFGRDEGFVKEIKEKYGVKYIRSRIPEVREERGKLVIRYEDLRKGTIERMEFDMVVLAVGLLPSADIKKLAELAGVKMDVHGYIETSFIKPVETNVPGILVCGAANSPMKVVESVAQGSAAALKASLFSKKTGIAQEEKKFIEVKEAEPKIGVFICGCNGEISNYMDVKGVAESAQGLKGVVYVNSDINTCEEAREAIEKGIADKGLNRIVFAGCSLRVYENIFREACGRAGLNPYLLNMVDIREQCAWVHDKEEATEKAKHLISMAVHRARYLEELPIERYPVIRRALVVGGGITGMSAAIDIANAGYEVHLVEKEDKLGGFLRKITELQEGERVEDVLKEFEEKVRGDERIRVITGAEIEEIYGRPGDYKARIKVGDKEEEIEFGACVLATGVREFVPEGYYEYGKDNKVVTQLEFEKILEGDLKGINTIVMIQCVGREEVGYCSRICCIEAVKNAIRAKRKNKDLQVFVLYRDVATYGRWELLYRKAREEGVIFIRYDEMPKYEDGVISVFDVILNDEILIKPDLVVLSTAILAAEDNERISKMLMIPTKNGFFMEMQEKPRMKLTPVDTPNKGVFICGSAIYPAMIDECIVQGSAAASRACVLLSKDYMESEPMVAVVDEMICSGCGVCEEVCPFGVIEMVEETLPVTTFGAATIISSVRRVARVREGCNGCGTCVSQCPSGAMSLRNFNDRQTFIQLDAM
ncbi:MAG: FAD-dependent oxidoreductase [Candidatus Methanospirareceae archaeon]